MDEKNLNSKPEQDIEDVSHNATEPMDQDSEYENSEEQNQTDAADEDELTDEETAKRNLLSVLEYVEIFAFAVLTVLFIFSFALRVCVVDGNSMNNTLLHQEKVLTTDLFYSPKSGDIVVFYENNVHKEPLVKRVIAIEGQTVQIDFNSGKVYVDGEALTEDYVYLNTGRYEYGLIYQNPNFNKETKIFKVEVPKDCVFVMGDNRNGSDDSRNSNIGFVTEQQIMGKVICRISPFTAFD